MRKRGEVAGGADGALRRNARMQSGIDQAFQKANQLAADSREPLQEAGELQHHDESDDAVVQQRTGAGAVRQQDVLLQLGALRSGDARLGEQAESRVDAVGGSIPGGELERRCM